MTRKIYRTAQGKMVDLGALQLQNENVRAVGNMGVNARGDIIDSHNKSINTRNQQVAKQYRRQTSNVTDQPIATSKGNIPAQQAPATTPIAEPAPVVAAPESSTSGGLAAAIARARSIKQEPLDPAPSRTKEGVNKI